MAQSGRAQRSGRWGRAFKSRRPDQLNKRVTKRKVWDPLNFYTLFIPFKSAKASSIYRFRLFDINKLNLILKLFE